MKNFKKILALVLAIGMVFALAACGEKDDTVKRGVLEGSGMDSISSEEHREHINVPTDERISYNSLTAALMDLESGKIVGIGVEECVANYIAAHNEKIVVEMRNFYDIMYGSKCGFPLNKRKD